MKLLLKTFIKILIVLHLTASAHAAVVWHMVAPGIAYTELSDPDNSKLSHIHAFKINLQKNQLKLAFAKDSFFPGNTVKWLAQKHQALIAVNGGFFTPHWQLLGLRVQNGHQINPIQPTRWWGIFYLKRNTPYIVPPQSYVLTPSTTLALQGGPRLIINGNIPRLKPGKAERTAIGITRDNQIIILATENWAISTASLAAIMKKSESSNGLNCIQALNLDGGSSTQLYASIGDLNLNIGSFSLITDILYVMPQKNQGTAQ